MSRTEPPKKASDPKPPEPVDPEPPVEYRCDLCGAPMLDRHCKLLCLQCGYQRDCSDP
jgi:hypothetical protein